MFRVNSLEDLDKHQAEPRETKYEEKKKYVIARLKNKKGKLKDVMCLSKLHKKHSEDDRPTLSVSNQIYPSCNMLIDLCRHRNRTVEDIKNDILSKTLPTINYHREEFSHTDFDKYLDSSYYDLYEQYIISAKEAIFKLQSSTSTKKHLRVNEV